MKLMMILLLPAMMVCTAQQTKTTAAKTTAAKKKAPSKAAAVSPKPIVPKPITIPAGAVEYAPNSFRYTDKQGKKWIYDKTPFGVMRRPESAASTQTPSANEYSDVKASDAGDSVRFERASPFGPVKWERKKSELNDTEKIVWEREQARAAQQKD